MTVWIVNPFDTLPAEGSRPLRYWLMAEAFAAAGHDVVYWTADFNHVTKKPRVFFSPPPLDVRLVKAPAYDSNISLRRMWSHWRWAKAWAAAARAAARAAPPDVIVASLPPLNAPLAAVRLAHSTGARAVVDIMDAWPDTFERVLPRRLRFLLAPLRRMAARAVREADAVTAVSERYVELAAACGAKCPARLFYHGIRLDRPSADPPDRQAAKPPNHPLRVVYAGGLGATYDLETVMEAVAAIDGATLAVAGAGGRECELRALAKEPRFRGKVSFAGYLGADALRRFLAAADVGVVPMSPESCVGVPYKLADYTAAGLAVASCLGGESARLLARSGAGAAYRPGDSRSLAAALRRLAADLPAAKAAARRLAQTHFDAAEIYAQYVSFAASGATPPQPPDIERSQP